MKNIILDFDNTMGVRGCDVDDGLALLYLLGNPERCRVLAACTTYGNAGIDVVDANTRALFEKLGLNIPVYRGAAGPGDTDTEAARFLAEACAAAPGEISVLATGSTTNLAAAAARDEAFFRNAADFTLMGGITESLVINGRIMDELNFSCDADATFALLASGAPVTIATAQNCLPAHVTRERLSEAFTDDAWLMGAIDYWFADMGERYAWDGFAVWDQVAAAALIKPELFANEPLLVALNPRLLFADYLERALPGTPQAVVSAPVIANPSAYLADAVAGWQRACEMLGLER